MEKKKIYILLILLFLVIMLRLPSLFEPYWHGDEGITLTVGQTIKHGEILYKDIADNKTPLLYVFASLAYTLFNFKLLLLFWMAVSTVIFFFLSKSVLKNFMGAVISSIFFVLATSLPIMEGNIANGEIFFLLPNLISIFLVWQGYKKDKIIYFLPAGIFFGLAFLIKVPAVFEFFGIIFFLINRLYTEKKKLFKILLLLLLGFLIPNLITVFYFFLKGALTDYWEYAFKWNFVYSSWKNDFIIPYGNLISKGVLFSVFLLLLFKTGKKLSSQLLFILLWFIFSLAGSLLSARHYLHYFIPILSSVSLFWGYLFIFNKKLFSAVLIIFFVWLFFFSSGPLNYQINYYKNFLDYKTGQKDINSYRSWFDPSTLKIYSASDFLKNGKSGKIFLWGNESPIYSLSERTPVGRFSAAYNIMWEEKRKIETLNLLKKDLPVYILNSSSQNYDFPELFKIIKEKYIFVKDFEGIAIYERKN